MLMVSRSPNLSTVIKSNHNLHHSILFCNQTIRLFHVSTNKSVINSLKLRFLSVFCISYTWNFSWDKLGLHLSIRHSYHIFYQLTLLPPPFSFTYVFKFTFQDKIGFLSFILKELFRWFLRLLFWSEYLLINHISRINK